MTHSQEVHDLCDGDYVANKQTMLIVAGYSVHCTRLYPLTDPLASVLVVPSTKYHFMRLEVVHVI